MTLNAAGKTLAIILALGAGLGVSLHATGAQADAQAGKQEFLRRCAACHGESGVGDGPISHHFKTPPANLTVLEDENGGVFPRDQVLAVIDGRDWLDAHGARAMPIWGEIFEAIARDTQKDEADNPEDLVMERIEGIVDYIEALQQ